MMDVNVLLILRYLFTGRLMKYYTLRIVGIVRNVLLLSHKGTRGKRVLCGVSPPQALPVYP